MTSRYSRQTRQPASRPTPPGPSGRRSGRWASGSAPPSRPGSPPALPPRRDPPQGKTGKKGGRLTAALRARARGAPACVHVMGRSSHATPTSRSSPLLVCVSAPRDGSHTPLGDATPLATPLEREAVDHAPGRLAQVVAEPPGIGLPLHIRPDRHDRVVERVDDLRPSDGVGCGRRAVGELEPPLREQSLQYLPVRCLGHEPGLGVEGVGLPAGEPMRPDDRCPDQAVPGGEHPERGASVRRAPGDLEAPHDGQRGDEEPRVLLPDALAPLGLGDLEGPGGSAAPRPARSGSRSSADRDPRPGGCCSLSPPTRHGAAASPSGSAPGPGPSSARR